MRRFEPVSAVLDQEIFDNRGKFVGWLCELLIDTAAGRIEYARINLPQGNGSIGSSVVIPWSAMRRTGDSRGHWHITATYGTLRMLAKPNASQQAGNTTR